VTVNIPTIEELEEAFKAAELKADETDAALFSLGPEADDTLVNDLKAEHEKEIAEVARLSQAIGRKEAMKKAKEEVPRQEPSESRPAGSSARVRTEPLTYRKGGPASFFHDVEKYAKDPGATTRLQRHFQEMEIEAKRAGKVEEFAMTSGSGSGIGFVAPQYLQAEWAELARAGRPLADAIGPRALPADGLVFNLPRVTTGATVPVQTGGVEGGAVTDSSPVTDTVQLTVETVAGKVDMSRQLFDRSNPAMEQVIGEDLASAYALSVDSEIINGPGSGGRVKGILAASGTFSIVVATPTAIGIYPKVADAIQRIDTGRYLPANLVVMAPRRWAQFLAALDGQNRPLVVPQPVAMNPMGVGASNQNSQGFVGYDLQGLPVLKDANIPTNLGAATNEDRIIIARKEDLYFFEAQGGPFIRVYEEVLSGTLQVRIQAFGYIAFTAERYPAATAILTGLTPPTF
jgi:HK97 family phage major capsid protein